LKGKWSEGGKERILRGEEDQNTPYVYVQRQHNETFQKLIKRGMRGGNGKIMLKVHSTHVWNYHNEAPSYKKCILIQNIIKLFF
jgi:hypothetical protein